MLFYGNNEFLTLMGPGWLHKILNGLKTVTIQRSETMANPSRICVEGFLVAIRDCEILKLALAHQKDGISRCARDRSI